MSLTPEEAARSLHGATGLRYSRVRRLVLGTGLRRSEALALQRSDVRLDGAEAASRAR